MPWVGLQFVSVVFPDRSHLLFFFFFFFFLGGGGGRVFSQSQGTEWEYFWGIAKISNFWGFNNRCWVEK